MTVTVTARARTWARVLGVGALALAACDKATVLAQRPDAPGPVQQPADDPLVVHAAVRDAVREYADALDTRDPARARERVVSETFDSYADLRRAALRSTRDELERMDLMTVLLILQIRGAVPRAELEALDGARLFDRAVAAGLVGSEASSLPLDEVWLDEGREHAEIRIEGEAVVWLRFETTWRVDLPAMIRSIGPALDALARERVDVEGKVFVALMLLEQSGDIDLAVVDGPLEAVDAPSDAPPDAASAGSLPQP